MFEDIKNWSCRLEKERAERENEMFPDEIDTPFDVPARMRFQKYECNYVSLVLYATRLFTIQITLTMS